MIDTHLSENSAGSGPESCVWPPVGPGIVEIDTKLSMAIEEALAGLVAEVELDFAALLDDSGALLGWAASDPGEDTVELIVESSGALAMGTFAAAQVLAAQLGGDSSRELVHHAGSRSFYLAEVAPGVALFSVWSGDLALGYLRDRTARASRQLAPILESSPTKRVARDSGLSAPQRQSGRVSAPRGGRGISIAQGESLGDGRRYVFEIG